MVSNTRCFKIDPRKPIDKLLKLAVDFNRDLYLILPINPFNHLIVNEINSEKLFCCISYKGIINSVMCCKSSNVLSSKKKFILGIVRISYIISF